MASIEDILSSLVPGNLQYVAGQAGPSTIGILGIDPRTTPDSFAGASVLPNGMLWKQVGEIAPSPEGGMPPIFNSVGTGQVWDGTKWRPATNEEFESVPRSHDDSFFGGMMGGLSSSLQELGPFLALAGGAASLGSALAGGAGLGAAEGAGLGAEFGAGGDYFGNMAALGSEFGAGGTTSGGNMNLLDYFGPENPNSVRDWFGMEPNSAIPQADYWNTMQGFDASVSDLGAASPSWIQSAINTITENPGSAISTAAKAIGLVNGDGSVNASMIGKLGTAGLGALLGSMNGAKQAGTTTTTQVPWEGQQPYLLDMFAKAQQAQNASSAPNALQTSAYNAAQNAMNNTLTGQAQGVIGDVLSGNQKVTLGANPYLGTNNPFLSKALDDSAQATMRNMMPLMNQANVQSGSFGNSGVADIYSKNIADSIATQSNNAMMNQYNATRDITNQNLLAQAGYDQNALNMRSTAAFNIPQYQSGLLSGAATGYGIGQNYNLQPYDSLSKYGQLVTGNYGGTTTNPYFTNPMSGLLGGALTGASIYKSLF